MPTKVNAAYLQRQILLWSQSLTIAIEDFDILSHELKLLIDGYKEGATKEDLMKHAREARIKREDMVGRLTQLNMELKKLGNS